MTPGDLEVSKALVRLEKGVSINRTTTSEDNGYDSPTFELVSRGRWHRDDCNHTTELNLTVDELAYVTLRPISAEVIRSHERYGIPLEHTDCLRWRVQNREFLQSVPTCDQLAVAMKRLGYEVKPVARVRPPRPLPSWDDYRLKDEGDHVSNEDGIHFQFPNATSDGRLSGSYLSLADVYAGAPWGRTPEPLEGPIWDRARCYGSCECGCTGCERDSAPPCDCAGCYCRRTCVPGSEASETDDSV